MKQLMLATLLLLIGCTDAAQRPQFGADVLFHDEFSADQIGPWQLEGDDLGQTAVVQDQLVINIDSPNTLQFATLTEPLFADFILEVDARILSGSPDNSYGILFRMQSPQQFYRFEITGNGLYMVERHEADGSWVRFVDDWTESAAINRGVNATNRLMVIANGPVLNLFANDVLLLQTTDGRYATGNIALDAGTFFSSGLQVAFDNLVIRRVS